MLPTMKVGGHRAPLQFLDRFPLKKAGTDKLRAHDLRTATPHAATPEAGTYQASIPREGTKPPKHQERLPAGQIRRGVAIGGREHEQELEERTLQRPFLGVFEVWRLWT
jgi:hypothetical protein